MTASKELYRRLYQETCRGMGHVERGSSSRYELLVHDPTQRQWDAIKEQTYATEQDLEGFLQGTRGNYINDTQTIEYELRFNEILPGEILSIIYQLPDKTNHGKAQFLKLDSEHYLVIDCRLLPLICGTIQEITADTRIIRMQTTCIPCIGSVHISHVAFEKPTVFHRLLDAALLPKFRQAKTAQSIMPLFEWLQQTLTGNMSSEQLDELFLLTSKLGVSTYVIRRIVECLISQDQEQV